MKIIIPLFLTLVVNLVQAQVLIHFETGSSKLSTESKFILDSILVTISDNDAIKIIGHTDSIGTLESNILLSKQRANVVKNYFIKKGNTSHVTTAFEGESKPTYSKNWQNRRAEIIILKSKVAEEVKIDEQNEIPKDEVLEIIEEANSDDLSLEQFKTSDKINLKNIQFKPGTAEFYDQAALDELRNLKTILTELSSLKIRIEGHVCCVNDRMLSELRAKKVMWYLIDHGIEKDRLSSVGYSNKKPLVPETSAENNQKNRRVEVRILER